ncbi:amidohydrolase family protein [Paenibacillus daejeonensis]|uniref:amidohydrolase family protein n=1 Tax=Paenibacillus daejeonensis TaxID=135193 RepID=UPI00035DBE9F|nr:amidohydrolase family protein [Paenibacillus daejeonensis]
MRRVIHDAHAYIGPDYHTYFHQLREYSVRARLAAMDDCGIGRSVLVPGGRAEEVEVNWAHICEAVRERPERFVGLYRVLPRQVDALEKMDRALRTPGISGLMLHPHWDVYVANSGMLEPIFDLASDYEVPVLIYSGDIPYTMPAQIADMAVRYPHLPIIMGHMAKTEVYQHATASALRSDNLFLETSGCNITTILEDAVAKLGASRILFGSGWPGMSPQAEISKVNKLRISELDRERLFSGTFEMLFPSEQLKKGEG